jgi:hypothetical protein
MIAFDLPAIPRRVDTMMTVRRVVGCLIAVIVVVILVLPFKRSTQEIHRRTGASVFVHSLWGIPYSIAHTDAIGTGGLGTLTAEDVFIPVYEARWRWPWSAKVIEVNPFGDQLSYLFNVTFGHYIPRDASMLRSRIERWNKTTSASIVADVDAIREENKTLLQRP